MAFIQKNGTSKDANGTSVPQKFFKKAFNTIVAESYLILTIMFNKICISLTKNALLIKSFNAALPK